MSKKKDYIPEAQRFSRQWWAGGLRNLVWVLLVATLVWVYADMEFTTEQDFRVTVRLTTGSSENLMLLTTGPQGRDYETTFKLQGNRSHLDTLQRRLSEHNGVLVYNVAEYYKPAKGSQTAQMADVLNHIINFSQSGLTLLWTDPKEMSFRLDRRIRVTDVPVDFQYTGATLAADPVVKPPKVAIFVSETAWNEVQAALPEAQRRLKTRQVDLKTVPTDRPIAAEIIPSITIKEGEPPVPVTPETDTVKVDVQVKQMTATRTFNVTPRIEMPTTWVDDGTWSEYRFVRKPSEPLTREITVQGAKTDLESLKPEDIDAYIVLRDDDKKPVESWLTREVVVRFPPKLKVELAPGEKPAVSFKLEKRNGTP